MNTFQICRIRAAKFLLALALALAPFPALADDTFDGEDITLIVPFAEGGGTDKWARFYASFMEELYPGEPGVDVENESGGAAGAVKAPNDFAKGDRDDGLTILAVSASNHFPYILSDRRVEYDYDDWEVLLVSPIGGVVYASPDLLDSHQEIDRLKGTRLKYIAQSPVGLDIVPIMAMELLGIVPQVVYGESRAEGMEKFEDEEVLIDFQTTPAYLEHVDEMARDDDAIPLFSLGILDREGELQRDPSFPDLPHFGEVYQRVHGKRPSGDEFGIWKTFLAAGFSAQKMLFVRKTISAKLLEAHRQGIQAIMVDPDFRRDAPYVLGRYPQYRDAEARRLKDLALGLSDKKRNEIGAWLVTDALPRWTGQY